jgi:predicted nucleic acid-binding protein
LTTTYVDSGVLIYAARGLDEVANLALQYLNPAMRRFVTSDYVLLEVLPKAIFHKSDAEVEFYQGFFKLNIRVVPTSAELIKLAMEEGCATGISGLDALHIAAAVFGGAEEFITSERVTKPIHRTKRLRVISIFGTAAT